MGNSSNKISSTTEFQDLFKDSNMFTTYKLTAPIPIPRGGSRVRLMKTGLVRNIYIDTSWKVKDIENEITSVFGDCFDRHDGDGLPYHYLR